MVRRLRREWSEMAEEPQYDLVCIGSGPAGQRGAVQAAKLGKRVAVIERQRVFGGVCVDLGTIPSKSIREAVITHTGLGQRFGPRQPGDFSASLARLNITADAIMHDVQDIVQREAAVVENQLRRNRIEVLHGEASFVDPHTLDVHSEAGVRRVRGENILIAVGTRPAHPDGVEIDEETVLTSDGVMRMRTLPRSLVIVGGGVIGIEYASIFAALGIEVTLVDRRTRPLEFLDWEIVGELIHQMRNANVTFRLNESVERVELSEGPPRRGVVHLASGKRLVADVVLFSIGRVGATRAINLPAAGLESDERGRLSVDEGFRTSVSHIFAAGDVIGFPSLASTSSEQGRLAVCTAFGVPHKPMSRNFPVGIYSIPEISMVGQPEHELTDEKIPYETGIARYREIARGQILGDDTGMLKLIVHRDTRQLLGVHAIGTGATELIHIGQAVLRLGGGLDYLLNTVFNYPTLAECYKVAALDAHNKLTL